MPSEIVTVAGGSVTSPAGFLAGATFAGMKTYAEDKMDLGILVSERPAINVATFTTNRVKAAPVLVSMEQVAKGKVRGVVANSGIANACVGDQGVKDSWETIALAAKQARLSSDELAVCSTGVIGVELPMALIRSALPKIGLSREGGHAFARAIMTTDTRPKEVALRVTLGGKPVTIAGCCKGAGMIHPNMATMLAFITTDAAVDQGFFRSALRVAVDASFNMISVDGDESTNDTVLCLANGAAGNAVVSGGPDGESFQQALTQACVTMAKQIVADGEGATRVFSMTVTRAKDLADARKAARMIVASSLVKSAVHGGDPNWGRILAALGQSGADLDERKIALYVNGICIMEDGRPIPFHKDSVVVTMRRPEVAFRLDLGLGQGEATAWGCDLTEEYVTFNSAYTT